MKEFETKNDKIKVRYNVLSSACWNYRHSHVWTPLVCSTWYGRRLKLDEEASAAGRADVVHMPKNGTSLKADRLMNKNITVSIHCYKKVHFCSEMKPIVNSIPVWNTSFRQYAAAVTMIKLLCTVIYTGLLPAVVDFAPGFEEGCIPCVILFLFSYHPYWQPLVSEG